MIREGCIKKFLKMKSPEKKSARREGKNEEMHLEVQKEALVRAGKGLILSRRGKAQH